MFWELDPMPTLFTALLAQHRPRIERPKQALPRPKAVPKRPSVPAEPSDKMSLLQAEHYFTFAAPRRVRRRVRPHPVRRIAVIGAGLAGLCAAYELQGLRYDVKVYEARERVGGRVESVSNFAKGKTAEKGGELIGSNHPLWNSYRRHFGLRFSDVKEYRNSPFRFEGQTLSFEQSQTLTEEMTRQLKRLSDLAETIVDPFEPWANRDARKLDTMVLADWVSKAKCSDLCKRAINGMLAADNGVPADQQSLLAVLAMVKGGGLDRYWSDTELFRCEGGNEQLAGRFQEKLNVRGEKRVYCSCPVTEIRKKNGAVELLTSQRKPLGEFDDVILAVPPSVWGTIRLKGFPDLARRFAKAPLLGRNVKCLMRLKSRFWVPFASSPTLSEDGPVDLTWETTEQENGGEFVMVAFSGAGDADVCSSWPKASQRHRYVEALQAPYPTIDREMDRLQLVDWPAEKWSRGSYYFPRPGEVTDWGPFWKSGYGDWLHFAGEHTCFAFIGYMEGALNSGYRLARRLALRDNILLG
jgi:monoamine oxidase